MSALIEFGFPPLGPTGEGDIVYPPGTNAANWVSVSRPAYWIGSRGSYGVTYQLDRPAVAFRCWYPGGSSPCNQETADAFIAWCCKLGFGTPPPPQLAPEWE
jgi:hypothetical protein